MPFKGALLDAVDSRKLSYPIPEYLPKKFKGLLGFELTKNEIGYFLSHRKTWQSYLAIQIPTLVFEDDFVLLPHFEAVINARLSHPHNLELGRLQALLSNLMGTSIC